MASVAPSQTRIINAALDRLGSTERVTSIDDTGSVSARRVKAVWDEMRRALLVRHPFNFAIGRRMLNEAGTAPAFGYARQFQVPGDCLRWLPPARGDRGFYEAEREGDFLLTNACAPLPFRGIFDIEDVSRWSPLFVMAKTICLAGWLAEAVTQSASLDERLGDLADKAIATAKRIDGLETGRTRRGAVTVQSRWLGARNRGYSDAGR